MLLALLYVLGTYVFVSLLLYSMHLESPPETVEKIKDQRIAQLERSNAHLLTSVNNLAQQLWKESS